MYRKVILTLLVIMAFALTSAIAGPTSTTKTTAAKPVSAKSASTTMHSAKLANGVAVCGCGKVFVPTAQSPTFTYEGKTYACCSEECHKKLSSMTPAEAAKAVEGQMQKLEHAAPATAAAPATGNN